MSLPEFGDKQAMRIVIEPATTGKLTAVITFQYNLLGECETTVTTSFNSAEELVNWLPTWLKVYLEPTVASEVTAKKVKAMLAPPVVRGAVAEQP